MSIYIYAINACIFRRRTYTLHGLSQAEAQGPAQSGAEFPCCPSRGLPHPQEPRSPRAQKAELRNQGANEFHRNFIGISQGFIRQCMMLYDNKR